MPPARRGHSLAYDAQLGQTLLYGGEGLSDTWSWNGSNWIERSPTNNPGVRSGHSMVHDPVRGRTLLVGGFDAGGTALSDTWLWDGSDWAQSGAVGPGAQGEAMLSFETTTNTALLFAGTQTSNGLAANDESWQWDGSSWIQKTPNATPSARSGHAIAYQSSRGRHLLFGGLADGGLVRLGDTWEWRRGQWSEVAAVGPEPRDGHALGFDAARDQTVLFGGDRGALENDTWVWNGSSWNELAPALAPSARRGHAMAFDTAGKRLILFGGDSGTVQNDTWQWDGTTWLQLTPATSPPARTGHSLSYDANTEELVLFGGVNAAGIAFDDTWAFLNGNWVLQTPGDQPVERAFTAMAYYAVRGVHILYGGDALGNLLDDTWEWAYTGTVGNWEQHALSTRPGFRASHAMAADSTSSDVIIFGGTDSVGAALDTTLTFRFEGGVDESCVLGFDADGDERVGCDDDDCWGYCAPQCPPGAACDLASPRCGDGVCNADLESCRLCPADCGSCTPVCGNFLCEGSENMTNCPGDCT